jgi:hypothetical protein
MPKTNRKHNSRTYRSGLEVEAAAYLKDRQKIVAYEKLKIEWEDLKYRTYTPDFELDNGIIIEMKGLFSAADRRKHIEIQRQHPTLDIRFVFSNARSSLTRELRVGTAIGAIKRAFSGHIVSYQKSGSKRRASV